MRTTGGHGVPPLQPFKRGNEKPVTSFAVRPGSDCGKRTETIVACEDVLNHLFVLVVFHRARRINQVPTGFDHFDGSSQDSFLLLHESSDARGRKTPANLGIAAQRARAGTRRINEDFVKAVRRKR